MKKNSTPKKPAAVPGNPMCHKHIWNTDRKRKASTAVSLLYDISGLFIFIMLPDIDSSFQILIPTIYRRSSEPVFYTKTNGECISYRRIYQ